MEWNRFVFPAPKKSYTTEHKRLIVIPRFKLDQLTEKIKESKKVSERKNIIFEDELANSLKSEYPACSIHVQKKLLDL